MRFIVRDAIGQALGYFCFDDELGRRSAAKLLSKDGARLTATAFAKLPELLRRPAGPTPLSCRGGTRAAPTNDLLTRRLVGRVKLRSLLPDGSHFLPSEQTQHLDVVKAIG